MPTTDAKKHVMPSGNEKSFNRLTLFEAFGNSIHDIVPVANTTERAQLVAALTSKAVGPSATNPLFVFRADARGLHRIEYTTDGTLWFPASGVMNFTTKADADSFGASNSGYLTTGDRATIAGVEYQWQGAWRLAELCLAVNVGFGVMTSQQMATLATISLPADAPAGRYLVMYTVATDAGGPNSRYHRVEWGGVDINDSSNQYVSNAPAGGMVASDTLTKIGHTGGAVDVTLKAQVNAAGPIHRYARLTVQFVGVA